MCVLETTSRHKIPVQGEKVTYTSAPGGVGGICIVKGLRGEVGHFDKPFVSAGITH